MSPTELGTIIVALVSFFGKFVKGMPQPIAWAGFVAGVLALLALQILPPEMKPSAIAIGCFIGAALLIGAGIQFWRWPPSPNGKPFITKDAPPSGKNVVSIPGSNNQVTISHIGDVTNQAPKPELKVLSPVNTEENADGTYTLTHEVEIVSPYPPGRLQLEAWASGILSLHATPRRAGMTMFGPSGTRPDHAFTTVLQPSGKYLIVVKVKKPTNVDIRYSFD